MNTSEHITLEIHIEDDRYQVTVDTQIVDHAAEMFKNMDKDMDQGLRMGPQYIEQPNTTQRAQHVADKLLTAMETGNEAMAQAMLGYILARLPTTRVIRIDTNGEPLNTSLLDGYGSEL